MAVWDVSVDFSDGNTYVNYRCPIMSPTGAFLGGGGVDMTLERFGTMLGSLKLFESSQAFLVSEDGTLLYHPKTDWIMKKKISDFRDQGREFQDVEKAVQAVLAGEEGFKTLTYEGRKQLWMYTPLKDLGWSLVFSVNDTEIQAPVRQALGLAVGISAGGLILLLAVLLFMTQSIVRPIIHMADLVQEIGDGDGDLTRRLAVDTDDELGRLGSHFNRFVETLHGIIGQVRDNARRVADATEKTQHDGRPDGQRH